MSDRPSRQQRITEAAADRDAGMDQVEAGSDPRVILAIEAEIEKAIASGRRFSANDIRDRFPVSDEHLVGARFRAATQRRVDGHPLMVRVGYTTSTLKSTRAHDIKVWMGWDAHQALHRNRTA